MNIPLSWLRQYVELPQSEKELTDKLTMIGHLLDKRHLVDEDVVIDLELRGNRADMFGLIGVARDVGAAFHKPLQLPAIAILPKTDTKSPLISAEKSITDKIKRFMAIKLDVKVGPSPDWMTNRLKAYGIEPINNVVDVTNYVMIETSHPMHAFDFDLLSGSRLHLRLAKPNESFETIQQGTTLRLSKEDVAIADTHSVQGITCIGGLRSKVTDATKTIILETAVYDSATCRRTARRHKITTEGGGRHEKHQDPAGLPFTLARAVKLLQDIADAKIVGNVSDYYTNPSKPVHVELHPNDIPRLIGLDIPLTESKRILHDLGMDVLTKKSSLSITVPTYRTDIEESADIIEEISRIYGYEHIPTKTLSGALPEPDTDPIIILADSIRDVLVDMQINEVITPSIIENKLVSLYEQAGKFQPTVSLVNTPDPDSATLRPSLIPNLVQYAKRSLGFRQNRIAFFELGKSYWQDKKNHYHETDALSILIAGETTSTRWNKAYRPLTVYDAKGVVEGLLSQLGVTYTFELKSSHPSLDPQEQAAILLDGKPCGTLGSLHAAIAKSIGILIPLYVAELSLTSLFNAPKLSHQPYDIAALYPPIIEDLSFTLETQIPFGPFMIQGKSVHPHIESITLLDAYENKRTVRVIYADATRSLSGEDIRPIREKLIALAQTKFNAQLKTV